MKPTNKGKIQSAPGTKKGLSKETIDLFKWDILGILPEDKQYSKWIQYKSVNQPESRKAEILAIRQRIGGSDNPVMLPYQRDWVTDKNTRKIADKSRRIGITWAESCDAVLTAAAEKGANNLYVSTRQELTKEYIDTCQEWAEVLLGYPCIPQEESVGLGDEKFLALTLEFPSGYKIYALSSNPANLRGLQGNVTIDEAAHHKDLPKLIKAASAMVVWGGKLRLISTHNGKTNPFNKEIASGRYSYHRTTIAEAFDQGLGEVILQKSGVKATTEAIAALLQEIIETHGEHAPEELFCEPSDVATSYFSHDVVVRATRPEYPVIRLELEDSFALLPLFQQEEFIDNWLLSEVNPLIKDADKLKNAFFGCDFARNRHLSVFVVMLGDDFKGEFNVPFMLEMRNVPHERQAQVIQFIMRQYRRFRKAAFDATGNGSYLAEAMATRFGFNKVDQVKFSEKEYLVRFPKYKGLLESGRLTIPYSEDIVDDHLVISLTGGVPKPPTRGSGEEGQQRHGDSCIALMLAASSIEKFRGCVNPPGSGSLSYLMNKGRGKKIPHYSQFLGW